MRLWKSICEILDIRDDELPTEEGVERLCNGIGFVITLLAYFMIALAVPFLYAVCWVLSFFW